MGRPSFLKDPRRDPRLGSNVKARFVLPAKSSELKAPPETLHPDLLAALKRTGLGDLYSHQADGLERLDEGKNLLISTPTASGKSLIYQLHAIDIWLKDSEARSLFVYPFKALTQDQRGKIEELARSLGFPEFEVEIYDGDTPSSRRRKVQKSPPPVIMTNPDMLHLAFMAYSENWVSWFSRLRLVVLDEAHVYRGIFGAHVHHLLWRFRRQLEAQKTSPTWIATSATLSNGGSFFRTLLDQDAEVIERSGAPQPERRLYLLSGAGSPYTLACEVMDRLLKEDARTLTFTKARKVTELLYSWLCRRDPAYRTTVSSYRAGFLPSERRRIEKALFDGSLNGVISTSAMEVGIDVGGLDACILVGYPGSLISLHQRMGRVGRSDRPADIFLIAMPDALDQYFVQHPDRLLNRPIEELVLDPVNPVIMEAHLVCAARESPLEDQVIEESSPLRPALENLDRSGELVLDATGTFWHTLRRRPHRELNLRTIGEGYRIVDGSGKAVGTIDGIRVHRECHPGAIYLHQGQVFEVKEIRRKDRKVVVQRVKGDHYTEVRSDKETEILEVCEKREMGPSTLHFGRLKVTETLKSYVKKRIAGGEVFGEYPLEAPPLIFETEGFWVDLPPALVPMASLQGLHLMGGIHAFEHAVIGIFPLSALADRWDLGGISYTHHPQVGGPAVFVYDGYPGGVGLARKGYDRFEELLEATGRLVRDCPCEVGCPACIHSPKCGNGNRPLDKAAAVLLMEVLEGKVLLPRREPSEAEARDEPRAGRKKKKSGKPGTLVFDLETLRLAAEVGGWSHIREMGMSLGVTWDIDSDSWRTYFEEEVEELVDDLLNAGLVIGFNVRRFDLEVLRGYTDRDLSRVKILDLLEVLKERLGFRVSLASLAEANFEEGKLADGLKAVEWVRQGRFDLLETYCRKDVELTGRLYKKGLEEGFLLFRTKKGDLLRAKVNGWK